MVPASWRAITLVLAFAAFARTCGTFDVRGYVEDEGIHVPTALSLGSHGIPTHSDWTHPPLSGLLRFATIAALGDGPAGWRIGNVILGTASILLLYLVARRLFPGTSVPILASALLALDPFHVFQSRTTFMEIPSTFFFLAYLLAILEFSERDRPALAVAGLAMGLTMATKDYFVLAIPVAAAHAWLAARRRGEARLPLAGELFATLVLLPAAVYVVCYLPWLGRGFDLVDLASLKLDGFREMRALPTEILVNQEWVRAGGTPLEWFVRPFFLGTSLPAGSGNVRLLLEVNNLPVRLASLPALAFSGLLAWRSRSTREALPLALFVSCYALFFAAGRPIFSYSALVVLPFAYLALARAVESAGRAAGRERAVPWGFLGLVALWALYVLPLATGWEVPRWPYEPILPYVRLMGGSP